MNISLTIKSLLILAIISIVFLSQIAYAGHSTLRALEPQCTPPITSEAKKQQCVSKIESVCNTMISGGGSEAFIGGFDGCVSDYSSDIVIAPATPTPSTPTTPPGAVGKASLKNPLGGIPNVETLFQSIMIAFITISIPFVVFFVIYAGFQYVTAQGNPEKIKAASKALLYAIIGGVIIIGAIAITTIVGNTVNDFK